MMDSWSVGKKIGAGFAAVVALATLLAAVAVASLLSLRSGQATIDSRTSSLLTLARFAEASERKVTQVRGFLLTQEAAFSQGVAEAHREQQAALRDIGAATLTDRERDDLKALEAATADHQGAVDEVLRRRRSAGVEAALDYFSDHVVPAFKGLRAANASLEGVVTANVARDRLAAEQTTDNTIYTSIALAVAAIVAALLIALALTRGVGGRLSEAVRHLETSAAELQAAANQQATSSKEQGAATAEASTTMAEVLSTARQIAESAQHVARMANETSGAARSGDATVHDAEQALTSMKGQVDRIVSQMLELGKRSQQIGGILEVINELADQTNILAINATIEAAGAGEHGARFSAVAGEIRTLADRVGSSAKEIRGLIDEIRASANATVMTTEDGLKAAQAGLQQFQTVAAAFNEIAQLVVTTAEAAREIELSTKQQTSAVEQVNTAVTNVTQAARENEVSSQQTLETATQLLDLSGRLSRFVQARGGA